MNKTESSALAVKLWFEGKYTKLETFCEAFTYAYVHDSDEGVDPKELKKYEPLFELTARYYPEDIRTADGKRIYVNDDDVLRELNKFKNTLKR